MASCKACGNTLAITIGAVVGLVLAAALLLLLLYKVGHCCLSRERKEQLLRTWRDFNLGVKLKILIATYQVATKIGSVYEVDMPPAVAELLSYFRLVVSIGISDISTPLQCLGLDGYASALAFWMIMPFVLTLLIVLVAIGFVHCQRRFTLSVLELALPPVLRLFFLIYPLVTSVAFDAFPCYDFADGSRWLKADVSIACDSQSYVEVVRPLAWAAICLYPVGLLVLNASLLLYARKAIVTQQPTVLSKAIDFLHQEYEPCIYWWELVEMLRRFILVGLMVVVYNGKMLQLQLGTLIATMLLFFQVQAAPFRAMSDDFLGAAASFSLLIMFLCSIR